MRAHRRIRNIRSHTESLTEELPETEEVTDAIETIMDALDRLERAASEIGPVAE